MPIDNLALALLSANSTIVPECTPALITWVGGTPPYMLSFEVPAQPCSFMSVSCGRQLNWTTTLPYPAGSQIRAMLTDSSTPSQAQELYFSVTKTGGNTDCLPSSVIHVRASANANANSNGGGNANAIANTDGSGNANANANTDGSGNSNANANADGSANANSSANANGSGDANANSNADDDGDANANANSDDDGDANANADANASPEADSSNPASPIFSAQSTVLTPTSISSLEASSSRSASPILSFETPSSLDSALPSVTTVSPTREVSPISLSCVRLNRTAALPFVTVSQIRTLSTDSSIPSQTQDPFIIATKTRGHRHYLPSSLFRVRANANANATTDGSGNANANANSNGDSDANANANATGSGNANANANADNDASLNSIPNPTITMLTSSFAPSSLSSSTRSSSDNVLPSVTGTTSTSGQSSSTRHGISAPALSGVIIGLAALVAILAIIGWYKLMRRVRETHPKSPTCTNQDTVETGSISPYVQDNASANSEHLFHSKRSQVIQEQWSPLVESEVPPSYSGHETA